MRAVIALAFLTLPALADAPLQSACLAMSEGVARVVPVAYGTPPDKGSLRIHYLGHAAFALATPGGQLVVTDYTGFIGNPDIVPDVVTMNIAHDSHYTDHPDPRIPMVLRGWGPLGLPARIDEQSGDLHIRNVTSDLRGPFGEGGRKDGNSIFLFEAAGLCIGHLGHLHQKLSLGQRAAIGRLDVVMVPVDGGFTMDAAAMAEVVRDLHAPVVLPMHWFSAEGLAGFLAQVKGDFEVVYAHGPELELSRATLPRQPTVWVLDPSPLP